MKSDNLRRDPAAPNPAFRQLVPTREFYEEPVLWVCTADHYSERACMPLRCPICNALMERAKERLTEPCREQEQSR